VRKLIAITTSVNYADYLAWCLESLARVADGICVVTEAHDASVDVARRAGVTPLVYDGWCSDGAALNKAGAVRFAQEQVHEAHPDAWYLLIDADIVLGRDAREVIEAHATDEAALYSARRVDFHSVEALRAGTPSKTYGSMFAGYFQLYRRHLVYPGWSHSAEACDLVFASRFASCAMLPMVVGHLGREQVNWEGRRSPVWC
jgi:hypothetical protein